MVVKKIKEGNAATAEATCLNEITRFDIIEAYKAIRTNVIYSLVGEDSKIICLSSPSPNDGKTTTCVNLAITFGQTGAKVLIIDGDLRKPSVHRNFKLINEPGLTNALGGFCSLRDAIRKTGHDNLDVLTSGHVPPNPAELLASDEMRKLIEKIKSDYEYIFIDAPPVNSVTDVAVLSGMVSGIVLVVRHRVSTFDEINGALEKLALVNAKILGFIMNDVSDKMKRKKYYRYTNYYAYKNKTDE
ncbi:MAG: CpsD/CapB family tyrosine-protein kinase [Bacillota bacterium]|nr:CpsD/CapB family tyrosine-protein kinase [Bacillota bacterium]